MGNPNRFEGQTLAKQCSDVEGQRIDFSMKQQYFRVFRMAAGQPITSKQVKNQLASKLYPQKPKKLNRNGQAKFFMKYNNTHRKKRYKSPKFHYIRVKIESTINYIIIKSNRLISP